MAKICVIVLGAVWLSMFASAFNGLSYQEQQSWPFHLSTTRARHARHLMESQGNEVFSTNEKGNLTILDNHKPVFVNCSLYEPSVKEEEDPYTYVMTVQAVDPDPPEAGGKISYGFVTKELDKPKFYINNVTGAISTTQKFDRDEPFREKEVYLTVRATDNGRPQLDDVCTIKVVIQDINDNAPIFDKTQYQEYVSQDTTVGQRVMYVSATDIDDGINSLVTYSLVTCPPTNTQHSDYNYFRIDNSSGEIFLTKAIDKQIGYRFQLSAKAQDSGIPPLYQCIDLVIEVVESKKKPPTIHSGQTEIYLKENYSDFVTPIFTVEASSNVEGEEEPVYKLLSGRTDQTNKQNTFAMVVEGHVAKIKLAKPDLDYEKITEYTLTMRVENRNNLAVQQSYSIKLEDVNDNIPIFTVSEEQTGTVLENEPPGTPVMQVRAIDADGTSAHNQVSYELADHQDLFSIDKNTGNITTLKEFDCEERDFYNVKVNAYDNSPSALIGDGITPNKGQLAFRILIGDKNDNKPNFTKREYYAEIQEDANTNFPVAEVKAEDKDTASVIKYSIIEGNEGDAFAIEDSGKIKVNSHLDYETKTRYELKVRAFDGIYEDFTKVIIDVTNVNDNPPVFLPYNNKITITEEELPPEKCIATLSAYDPDKTDRDGPQDIVFFVVKQDQQKLLTIDQSGCLSLIHPLDRDPPNGFEVWQVLIAADDENGSATSLRATTEVLIHLRDVNDNAPFLDMIQPVIWNENQPAGPITKLIAKDYDSDTNGPPFSFALADTAKDDIKNKFEVGKGGILTAKVQFDREEIKEYILPITIIDSGEPERMTGTSTLRVVIGDVNDNAMQEGASSIFVYNYKGEAPNTEIGRVYVNDPDDWDLPDKQFHWKDVEHPNFSLNHSTGMITMLSGTQGSTYVLEFVVDEESFLISKHSVAAIVNVTVKEIPEEAVDKSGSIRFFGITAEEFVAPGPNGKPSKQHLLREKIAKILNVSLENVDVFTVLHSPHNESTEVLDVRFSAHGSPYYAPEKLNANITLHQKEIEQELKVQILMINIDECLLEKVYCATGSCYNFLNKSNIPYAVYTNTSSFVGVRAVVDPFCQCYSSDKVICLNGGTPVGERCECIEGFEGPHCELISIGFAENGWALYPPFAACEEGHVSLEVTPQRENGLVFYIGPMVYNSLQKVQDFMSLEIRDGYPRLLVDFGSGTSEIDYKQAKVADGTKHTFEILWSKTTIELKVDNCHSSSCLYLKAPQGPNEYLNVNGPLQVGGSIIKDLSVLGNQMGWNFTPTSYGFQGCIRNFTFNGKTYNLGMPSDYLNIDPGCNRGVAKAVSFRIDTNFLIAFLVCFALLLILLLAVVVHRRKTDDMYKDTDDIRENIINYEDEGGGEGDMTGYDLNVLRMNREGNYGYYKMPMKDNLQKQAPDEVPDICGFLNDKKNVCDNDPDTTPFDDVRFYAYEGDGNSTGSLSSLASGTDEGDLNFDYLSNFGPRFRKLADMYGEDPSDEEDENFHHPSSESWC